MHLVRAASLTGFKELMTKMDLDTLRLVQLAGVPIEALDSKNADLYLPIENIETLYALAEQESQEFDLAIRLGRQQELSSLLGVLGFVMQQASTVGEALYELQHYFSFQAQRAFIQLDVQGDYLALGLVVQDAANLPSIQYSSEFALAAGVSILRSLCGDDWRPIVIHFMHSARINPVKLRKYFHAPVQFEQEQNAILFKASDLAIPVSNANPKFNKLLQTYLAQLEEQFTNDPIAQIEQLIQQALNSGSCGADKVANFMGVHRRTLHRILKKSGTSYTELLDKVRQDMALRLLQQSNVSITLISDMLCYSELSAFSRAFKRWFGDTPQAHKKKLHKHSE